MTSADDVLQSVAGGEGGREARNLIRNLTPGQTAAALATLAVLVRADPDVCARAGLPLRARAIAVHTADTFEYIADEEADAASAGFPADRLPDFAPETMELASDVAAAEAAWRARPGRDAAELVRDAACHLRWMALRMAAADPDGPAADPLRAAAAETGESLAYAAIAGYQDEIVVEELISVMQPGVRAAVRAVRPDPVPAPGPVEASWTAGLVGQPPAPGRRARGHGERSERPRSPSPPPRR